MLQNFKTGGIDKMGLGYEQLKALKPELIYCSVSGYDRHGAEAKRPAALTGLMGGQARLEGMGTIPVGNSPAEFEKFIAAESVKWGKVIRSATVTLD